MKAKKAKALKRIAKAICEAKGQPGWVDEQYKKMKKVYKQTKR